MQMRATQQQQLRAAIGATEAAMVNAPIAMRKSLDALHDDAVEELRSEILAADDELRGHLTRVLGGSIRNRVIGVVLDRRHDCFRGPAPGGGATGSPRTEPSRPGQADDCIAPIMRKSNRARSTSNAALLLA
jgi:hypothetical protein